MATTLITRTERLLLTPLTVEQEDEAFKVYNDARIWEHRPQARHEEARQTREIIAITQDSWTKKNLGPWGIYLREHPTEFIGVGGLSLVEDQVWDLKYRLRPDYWGAGFATELAEAARAAARRLTPDIPITGRVTTNHPVSARILEKLGLTPVWEGRRIGTADDPSEPDVRIYADRELPADILAMLQARP